MDDSLLEWKYIDGNKMMSTYEIFYVLIRKTDNIKPYELRIFKKGDIWVFVSFSKLNSAIACAEELIFKYYKLKDVIKNNDNNIIYIKEWQKKRGNK